MLSNSFEPTRERAEYNDCRYLIGRAKRIRGIPTDKFVPKLLSVLGWKWWLWLFDLMTLFCECNWTTQVAPKGRFIQTLTEKSISIQNMRVQVYDRAVKDDNGSKELVDLRNRNTFVKYLIMVLINVFMSVWYFC